MAAKFGGGPFWIWFRCFVCVLYRRLLKSFLIEDILSWNDNKNETQDDHSSKNSSKSQDDHIQRAASVKVRPTTWSAARAAWRCSELVVLQLLNPPTYSNATRLFQVAEHAHRSHSSPFVRRAQRKMAAPKATRSAPTNAKSSTANPLNDLIQMTSSTIKHMDLGQKPNTCK